MITYGPVRLAVEARAQLEPRSPLLALLCACGCVCMCVQYADKVRAEIASGKRDRPPPLPPPTPLGRTSSTSTRGLPGLSGVTAPKSEWEALGDLQVTHTHT